MPRGSRQNRSYAAGAGHQRQTGRGIL